MNDIVNAVIEIPAGSKNKYEIKNGIIKLDRVLYSAMSYPAEYGFLENTLDDDGDPLDILVMSSEKTFPGCVVPSRVVGVLKIIDNGFLDYKIISVVSVDPRYKEVNNIEDLGEFELDEIKNFFENYKTLQNIKVEVENYYGKEEALKIIEECKIKYNK